VEVKRIDEALQVPVQAVLERGKKFYCIVSNSEGNHSVRKVAVDSSNGQSVVIKNGLAIGEEVLLAPQNYEDDVTFPEPVPPSNTPPNRPPKPKLAAVDPALPSKSKGAIQPAGPGAASPGPKGGGKAAIP
jgi:hypothetical protein